jgi:peptidoglycan/xylan/chitin deacetylase (PgdA/CDA1 family)
MQARTGRVGFIALALLLILALGGVLWLLYPPAGGLMPAWRQVVVAVAAFGGAPARLQVVHGLASPGTPRPSPYRGPDPVDRGPANRPVAALMFNVDWGEEYLPGILDVLVRERARATFFVTGWWAGEHPDLVRRMAQEGHEVGNHGAEHVHPAALSRDALLAHLAGGEQVLTRILGRRPAPVYAPAYGEFSATIVEVAAAAGYVTVRWTSNTGDYTKPPPAVIVSRATGGAVNGGLVLMHPTTPTLEALPGVIRAFRERGLILTTVSDVLGLAPPR